MQDGGRKCCYLCSIAPAAAVSSSSDVHAYSTLFLTALLQDQAQPTAGQSPCSTPDAPGLQHDPDLDDPGLQPEPDLDDPGLQPDPDLDDPGLQHNPDLDDPGLPDAGLTRAGAQRPCQPIFPVQLNYRNF